MSNNEHKCTIEDIEWEQVLHYEYNGVPYVFFNGKCKVCGKLYEDRYYQAEVLWDKKCHTEAEISGWGYGGGSEMSVVQTGEGSETIGEVIICNRA